MAALSFAGRLEQLARASRRSVWWGAVLAGLPLAGTLGGVASFALIDSIETSAWWQRYFAGAGNSTMLWGYALFYLPLWLAALLIGIAPAHYLLKRRFDVSYQTGLAILHHTDVPVLIANGQVAEKLTAAAGVGLPHALARRDSGEDQLKLAAANLRLLQALAQSAVPAEVGRIGHLRLFLYPLPLTAYGLGSVVSALVLGCPFNFGLSCLLGPPLVIAARSLGLPFAEYHGYLAAICDFLRAAEPVGSGK
ncbi:hypothetical protein JW859_04515 [bacterium]|nr:hypothetical protein [bacterium]